MDVGNAYEPAALAEIEAARKRITGTVGCVISGGNIDTGTLETILAGNTP